MNKAKRGLVCISILTFLLVGIAKAASPTLTVLYMDRRPYYFKKAGGGAGGFLVEISRLIFQEAGIPVVFKLSSPSRILWIIKHSSSPVCSIGWFRTKERLKFAKFSLPIYQNQPLVALTLRNLCSSFKHIHTLRELFQERKMRWGRLSSFSYGSIVDFMEYDLHPTTVSITGSQKLLIRMLVHRRIDYILISPEEVKFLIKESGYQMNRFCFICLRDISRGNKRYIMFSRNVPDSLIRKVNDAIKKIVPLIYPSIDLKEERYGAY